MIPLVAELLIPTRAAGFIKAGQRVKLMYDAFPYQRYGIAEGWISRISRSVVAGGELLGPVQVQEPVYRAAARLERQGLHAHGAAVALQPGMLLKADIALDQQNIFEIVTAPIRAATDRL